MNLLKAALLFYFGMMSMWNFMRTTYVYGGVWGFYVLDTVVMIAQFSIACWACRWLTVSPHVRQPE